MKKLPLILLVLLVLPLATALTVNTPVDGYTYYDSLIDSNLTWSTPLTSACKYSINYQQNISMPCDNEVIVDLPFNAMDNVNLTFYENNDSVNVAINVNNNFSEGVAITTWLLVLLPIIFAVLFWILAFKLDKKHEPFRIFLTGVGFTFIMYSLNYMTLAVRSYVHNSHLLRALNSFTYVYGWLYWGILVFIIIGFLVSVFNWMNSTRGNSGK